MRLIDTEKIISLGANGTSQLDEGWAITSYTRQEVYAKGFEDRLGGSSTKFTVINSPSWPDLDLVPEYSSQGVRFYTWSDATSTLQILYKESGFSCQALCGSHDSTIYISKVGSEGDYYLCNSFLKDADFSQIIALILDQGLLPPFTGDKCLGITSSKIVRSSDSIIL